MLIGFNNDVKHRGKTFHIQTEDRGLGAKEIETQIFNSGAILDTRIVSYEELMSVEDREERNAQIRKLMQNTHRQLFALLKRGRYDEMVGLEPLSQVEVAEEPDFTPSQERVPDSARRLEEGEEMAIADGGDHVDINSLKAKLAKMDLSISSSQQGKAVKKAPEPVIERATSLDDLPLMQQSDRMMSFELDAFGVEGVDAWDGCAASTHDVNLASLF